MDVSLFIDPIFFAVIHQDHCLFEGLNLLLSQAHYICSKVVITNDFQVLIVFIEQIINGFIVDFKITNPETELDFILLGLL